MQKSNKAIRLLLIVFLALCVVVAGIGLAACSNDETDVKGIEAVQINSDGKLEIKYTDGSTDLLANVVGKDGSGIAGINFDNETGALVFTLTDGSQKRVPLSLPEAPVQPEPCEHPDCWEEVVRAAGVKEDGTKDCDAEGIKLHICKNKACGYAWAEKLTRSHEWEATKTAPDCTHAGTIEKTCKVCAKVSGQEVDPEYPNPVGHKWQMGYTTEEGQNLCVDGGYICATCEVCSVYATAEDYAAASDELKKKFEGMGFVVDGKFENLRAVAPLGHDITAETTLTKIADPTADTEGKVSYMCNRCKDSVEVKLPKLNATDYTRTPDPAVKDCAAVRDVTYKLNALEGFSADQIAHLSYVVEEAGAGHHTAGGLVYKSGAKVEIVGETEEARAADMAAKEISLVEGEILTCKDAEGEIAKAGIFCADCGQIITVYVYTTQHTIAEGTEPNVTVEPTCTAAGKQTISCSVCGKLIEEDIPAKGHDWSPYTLTVTKQNDDGTANGTLTRTCSVCNAEEKIEVTNCQAVVTKEATCTETGLRSWKYTDAEGNAYTTDAEVIAKISHENAQGIKFDQFTTDKPMDWPLDSTTNPKYPGFNTIEDYTPDCGATFEVGSLCKHCSQIIMVPAKTAHELPAFTEEEQAKYDSIINGTLVVCTEAELDNPANVFTYTCARCGESFTEKAKVVGHDYVTAIINAQTNEDGTVTGDVVKKCSRCDASETIAAGAVLTKGEWKDGKVGTCKEAGLRLYTYTAEGTTLTIEISEKAPHELPAETLEHLGKEYTDAHGKYIVDGRTYEIIFGADGKPTNGLYLFEGQAAACDTTGTDNGGFVCPICTEIVKLTVKSSHRFDMTVEPTVVTDADCTNASTISRVCLDCGQPITITDPTDPGITPALGHNPEYAIATAPTAAAEGKAVVTCSRCDIAGINIILPKLTTDTTLVGGEGKWTTIEMISAVTCEHGGSYKYTLVVPALGEDVSIEYTAEFDADAHNYGDNPILTWYKAEEVADGAAQTYIKYEVRFCNTCEKYVLTKVATGVAQADVEADKDGVIVE